MTDEPPRSTSVRVAIAIVRRGDLFLVRIRPPGGPMPGVHEFAGGKCESGETPEEAARREAQEEIGMQVAIVRLRTEFEHRYPHGHIHLHYFDAVPEPLFAEPAPESGFRWAHVSVLPTLTFPPANEAIIRSLVLEFAADGGTLGDQGSSD